MEGFQQVLDEQRAVPFLEQLADEAPFCRSSELSARWRDFERRLLEQLRQDEHMLSPLLEHPAEAEQTRNQLERIRNLAWEVAVTTDLGCVHVRAIRKLAALLRERAQRPRIAR